MDCIFITDKILSSQILKMMRLIVFIMICTYFVGQYWYIFTLNIHEFSVNSFLDYGDNWNIIDQDLVRQTLISIYFAFTSLSTVGFGDYYPVSSLERIVCAFVLLIGVAMFSYILGELIAGVNRINKMNKPFGKEEDLDRFFKILYYFNNS